MNANPNDNLLDSCSFVSIRGQEKSRLPFGSRLL